jgi:hypothetical protein
MLGAFEPQDPRRLSQQFHRFASQIHFDARSGKAVAQSLGARMKLSSIASLEAETRAALGRRFSVLEMEHSGVELERHTESSSK